MAIAQSGSTNAGSATGTSLTVGHTVPGASDEMTVLLISSQDETINAPTWSGDATSLLSTYNYDGNARSSIYYVLSPTAETDDAVVTCGVSQLLAMTVMTFSGVSQDAPWASTGSSAGGYSGNPSVIVASEAGQLVIDVPSEGLGGPEGLTVTGASQTTQTSHSIQGVSTAPGAAAVTMSWSGAAWVHSTLAYAIIPAPEAGGETVEKTLADEFTFSDQNERDGIFTR